VDEGVGEAFLDRPFTPREIDLAPGSLAAEALRELDKALADERDLRPPQKLDALKQRWLARAQVVRDDIAVLRQAARRRDLSAINDAFDKGSRDDQRSNALAAQLGLKVCSKP
jgi:hypothetical protein